MLGALSDRFGRRPVLAAIYAGRIFIFAGFFLIRDNPMAILAVAVLGGITMAGTGSMTSALTADIYGRFSVSSVFGLIFLVHQTGSAVGSWLAGALFETTGGYGAAFALACLFLTADLAHGHRHAVRFLKKELFTAILSSANVKTSQPLTSTFLPSAVVPRKIHSETPRLPATKWRASAKVASGNAVNTRANAARTRSRPA
jgi:MFS family permease